MCFSANASFVSGTLLSVIGIVSIRKTTLPSQLALAAIPFIFAMQQFSEGFVWLSLTHPVYSGWQHIPQYIFLTFGVVVWPAWMPVSTLLLEKDRKSKQRIYLTLGIGLVLTCFYTWCLITSPVSASIDGYHIRYTFGYPSLLLTVASIFYGIATILPSFLSSVSKVWMLGFVLILSYIASFIFYHAFIVSVWCYFAALLSAVVYWILYGLKRFSPDRFNVRLGIQS